LWLIREKLLDRFDQHLAAKGYMARGGQIIDASIVPVPTQRNSRDENAELQAGRTPVRLLVASPPVQDLLLRANYLFVPAMMASAPTGEPVQQAAFR
jgi:hypothetical protein